MRIKSVDGIAAIRVLSLTSLLGGRGQAEPCSFHLDTRCRKGSQMRRIVSSVVLLLAIVLGAQAQMTGITSVYSDSSAVLFGNALDGAVTVSETGYGPAFSGITNSYLFAGVTNLEKVVAQSDLPFGSPLWCGYFHAGRIPWSLFGGFFGDAVDNPQEGGRTYLQGTPVVVGDTTYQWIRGETDMIYDTQVFEELETSAQFLIGIGPVNTGLFIGFDMTNASPPANNYERFSEYYYDSGGGATAPQPLHDYGYHRRQTEIDVDKRWELGLPVFFRTGPVAHTVILSGDLWGVEQLFSDEQSYGGAPETALGPRFNVTDTIAVHDQRQGISAAYTVTLPPFMGSHPENEFSVGISGNFQQEKREGSQTYHAQTVTYIGGGGFTDGERDEDEWASTWNAPWDIGGSLNIRHSWFLDLGEHGRVGLEPGFKWSISYDNPLLIERLEVTDRQDNDADGSFGGAPDRIIEHIFTYENASLIDPFTYTPVEDAETVITTYQELSLPISLEITPPNWPFSVVLGSKPVFTASQSFSRRQSATVTQVTDTNDGLGLDVSNMTVNPGVSGETRWQTFTFDVSATHNIGLSMLLGERVRLDTTLDLGGASSIFDFRNLTVQGIVALSRVNSSRRDSL